MKKSFLLGAFTLLFVMSFVSANSLYTTSDTSYSTSDMGYSNTYSKQILSYHMPDVSYNANTITYDATYTSVKDSGCGGCGVVRKTIPMYHRNPEVIRVQQEVTSTCGPCVISKTFPTYRSYADVSYTFNQVTTQTSNCYSY